MEDRIIQDDIDLIYECRTELQVLPNIDLLRTNKMINTLENF